MPSEFDILVSNFAAPVLMEHLGEWQSLRIIPSGPGQEAVVDAILSTPTVALIQDIETGEIIRREQMTATVLRSALDAKQIDSRLGLRARFIVAGAKWSWDQDTTQWGPSTVTIGLIRKPLVQRETPQRANV